MKVFEELQCVGYMKDGCTNPVTHKKQSLCHNCYHRQYYHERMSDEAKNKLKENKRLRYKQKTLE